LKAEICVKIRLIGDLNVVIENYLVQINEKDNKLKQKEEIVNDLKSKIEDKVQNVITIPQDNNSPLLIFDEFLNEISKIDDVIHKIRDPIDTLKNKLKALHKNNTIESEQQTDEIKFIHEKLKISNFNLDFNPPQLKNANAITNNDKEILAKQDIIFHQMMRQKAVFEIEKLVIIMYLLRF
jgi:hypothetical protein